MKKWVVGIIGFFVIIAFLKFFLIVGGIAALGFLIYFVVKAVQDPNNRNNLLKTRVLPAAIALILCFGIGGSLPSGSNSSSSKQAASSSKVEHHKSSSSDDDIDDSSDNDDSESDDLDDSSSDETSDTDDESESTDVSSNDEESTTDNDDDTDNAPTNHGDMTTDQQGTIVGNSRMMVYHTPDQHGYRMNSANAVYFKSEAEAQAAGYRKSLR